MDKGAPLSRDALREKLIEVAEELIEESGLHAVKARELARRAGCALGSIYNVFADLDGLILAVNVRTFQKLAATVSEAVRGREDAPPIGRMTRMAQAYLQFALEHGGTWRALFEFLPANAAQPPEWYRSELDRLLAMIEGPVADRFHDLPAADIALLTRALFSSVHGMVSLSLQKRLSAVPLDDLERMIALLMSRLEENPRR